MFHRSIAGTLDVSAISLSCGGLGGAYRFSMTGDSPKDSARFDSACLETTTLVRTLGCRESDKGLERRSNLYSLEPLSAALPVPSLRSGRVTPGAVRSRRDRAASQP
jgi:hypothetical protein